MERTTGFYLFNHDDKRCIPEADGEPGYFYDDVDCACSAARAIIGNGDAAEISVRHVCGGRLDPCPDDTYILTMLHRGRA